jgi:hypothetical protein
VAYFRKRPARADGGSRGRIRKSPPMTDKVIHIGEHPNQFTIRVFSRTSCTASQILTSKSGADAPSAPDPESGCPEYKQKAGEGVVRGPGLRPTGPCDPHRLFGFKKI